MKKGPYKSFCEEANSPDAKAKFLSWKLGKWRIRPELRMELSSEFSERICSFYSQNII